MGRRLRDEDEVSRRVELHCVNSWAKLSDQFPRLSRDNVKVPLTSFSLFQS
jgi:hypothetical protein